MQRSQGKATLAVTAPSTPFTKRGRHLIFTRGGAACALVWLAGCAPAPVRDAAPAASAAPAAAAAKPAEGMPARGERWRYGYRDQRYRAAERFFTVEVLGVSGQFVQERFTVEGGDITQDVVDGALLRFITRPIAGSIAVVELAPYSRALYNRVDAAPAGYPIAVANAWQLGRTAYAEERVSVPAGTYDTLRVEVTGNSPYVGMTGTSYVPARFIYTGWYSAELHRYVKIHHQTWNRAGEKIGDEIVRLMTHELPR